MSSDDLLISPRAPRALGAGARLRVGQVIDWAGGGSTGHVYRVVDATGAQIAVREYFPPEIALREGDRVAPQAGCEQAFQDGLKLFEEDGWQLAAQEHPGLLKVLQVWPEHGTVYLSMPWCEGHTLAEIVRASPMPPSQAQLGNWLRAMADALTLVHRRRGLHGNLGPGQVMQLDSGRLLLMEFARARRCVTRDPREIERDPFAALECGTDPRCGSIGPWTDVYALAATLYFVLRGRTPQSAARRAAFDAQEPLVRLAGADYGETFLRGIDAGLALRPRARPQSLPDFLAGLGLGERRIRRRAIGESLLINLPVAEAATVVENEPAAGPRDDEVTAVAPAEAVVVDEPAVRVEVSPIEALFPEPPPPAADPHGDWPTTHVRADTRADKPPAKTQEGVPWRGDDDATWPESAWPVTEAEAAPAASGHATPARLARRPRARAFAALAGVGALAGLFGVWLLQVQGPGDPVPLVQNPPPPAAVATGQGASWPIPDPLEPTAAGPAPPSAVAAEPAEPIEPKPSVGAAPAAPAEAAAAPAVSEASEASLPVDVLPPEPPPARAVVKPRAAPAPVAPRAVAPAAPAAADDAAVDGTASRCPELLARQYTGRPLDAAERAQLQAQCR